MDITIPYKFIPRDYQKPLFRAIQTGTKRAFCLWHRRAGKDKTLINIVVTKALQKKGVYYYFFPTYAQAKKVIWDGICGDGMKFTEHFPEEITKSKNDQEMKIELTNGSIFQLVGTDKYDSIRGTNPIGCVFSEFAFQNPMAWDVVRPILRENGGFALFNTTPNGKNHAYDLWENVKDNDDWFTEVLTVTRTNALSEEDVQEERMSGMSEEMVLQEYYCSFDVGMMGSYYGDQLRQLNDEKRFCTVPFYQERDIDIYFDLGINDMMSIWFKQDEGQNINLINYYETNNKTLEYYFGYIEDYINEKRGKLGTIYIPHDSKKRDLVTGKTVAQEFAKKYGEHKIKIIEQGSLKIGIEAVRKILPRCWIDKEACKQGLRCLENYHREWDEVKKVFRDRPTHDWSSHGADAFRYLAMSYEEKVERGDYEEERYYKTDNNFTFSNF